MGAFQRTADALTGVLPHREDRTPAGMRTAGAPSLPAAPYRGETYYEMPSVKASPWHGLVSTYIFVAGLSGSAQVLATLADLFGRGEMESVVRRGRHIALLAPAIGGPLLIIDLHTPKRFYNMFRIFRSTSPMSIGTYILSAFSLFSGITVAAELLGGRGRTVARIAQVPAALAGAGLSFYTAALLSATSTPLWAAAPRLLAARFAASSMATAAAALSLAEQVDGIDDGSIEKLEAVGAVAAVAEATVTVAAERRYREMGVADPLERGSWATLDKGGALALGIGVPLALFGLNMVLRRRSRAASAVAGLAVLAGGMMMRHAILEAGNDSANLPRAYFSLTQSRGDARGRR
jgi:formate-dependent nitrite reductase membrane component NrfD